jgi:hypothetical protein
LDLLCHGAQIESLEEGHRKNAVEVEEKETEAPSA